MSASHVKQFIFHVLRSDLSGYVRSKDALCFVREWCNTLPLLIMAIVAHMRHTIFELSVGRVTVQSEPMTLSNPD